VCDPELSAKERAVALVSAFSIDEKIANLVNTAPGVPRLGLTAYQWWSEGLHGLAWSPGTKFGSGNFTSATSFPSPIILGAAFDDDLIKAIGEVIGTETRAFDNNARAGLDLWVNF
jgi:beta-D-xylosidase 4